MHLHNMAFSDIFHAENVNKYEFRSEFNENKMHLMFNAECEELKTYRRNSTYREQRQRTIMRRRELNIVDLGMWKYAMRKRYD